MKQLDLFSGFDSEDKDEAPPPAPLAMPAPLPVRRETPAREEQRASIWDDQGRRAEATAALRRHLTIKTGKTIILHITDNRRRIISFDSDRLGVYTVRAHWMFLEAEPDIQDALAEWILHPKSLKAGAVVNRFIRTKRILLKPPRPRKINLETQGAVYDLEALRDEVNQQHFNGALSTRITWSPGYNTKSRRKTIRFGWYDPETDIVHIHPVLDQRSVPIYFVRYIVFHELLHAYLGVPVATRNAQRRRVHTREFYTLEKAYPDYERATAWERNPENMKHIYRSPAPPLLNRVFQKNLNKAIRAAHRPKTPGKPPQTP